MLPCGTGDKSDQSVSAFTVIAVAGDTTSSQVRETSVDDTLLGQLAQKALKFCVLRNILCFKNFS